MEVFLEEYYRRKDPKCLKDDGDQYRMSVLTDRTILKIYKTVNLRDQMKLADSSERLSKLFEIYCIKQYKELDLKVLYQLHSKYTPLFFKKVGHLIHTMRGVITYEKREEIIHYIVNFTPNVKALRLWHSELKVDNLHHLFLHNNSVIQHLSLVNCNLNDYSIIPILQLRTLRSLSVALNKGITGKYLTELRGLHLLDISGCIYFEAEKLLEIAQVIYYLRILNMQDCHCVDVSLIKGISKHAFALEKLIFTANCKEIYKYLPSFTSVKYFEIKCMECPEQNFFNQLVKSKQYALEGLVLRKKSGLTTEILKIVSLFENLREIYLGARCTYDEGGLKPFKKLVHLEKIIMENCICINNSDILYLIEQCTQLKELRIIRCPNVSATLFEPIMKKAEGTCKHQMYMCRCGVTLGFVKLRKNGNNSKYIYCNCKCNLFPMDDDLTKLSNIIN